MDKVTLYSHRDIQLTVEMLEILAGDGATVQAQQNSMVVSWRDVRVKIQPLPAEKLPQHLEGFQNFVRSIVGDEAESFENLLNMIGSVEAVFGCTIEPGFDRKNAAKSLLVSIATSLEECLMFDGEAIFSPYGELWFGAEDTEPFADLSELTVRKVMLDSFPDASPDQLDRYNRVRKLMDGYRVPELMKRVWVDDEGQESLQSTADVARRVLALHAVVCIARGRPPEETLKELKASGAESALSPEERKFLALKTIPDDVRQSMIWKLERLWLLMWSLRHIDEFTWPNEMCDVDGLHKLIFAKSKDPKVFIEQAQMRSKKSILDASQLIIQLQAVIRSAIIDDELIPGNLNWKKPSQEVEAQTCPAIGIVAERHFALNWLRRFQDADWDNIEVPTVPYAVIE